MTVLKLKSNSNTELGMVNWFGVHNTNVGPTNKYIHGDNKGLASYDFEKIKGTNYYSRDTFVGAFAQAAEGDVTPNLNGKPNGRDDYNMAQTIANRQRAKATSLYNGANTPMKGGIDYRHAYVNFAGLRISPEFTGTSAKNTCQAAHWHFICGGFHRRLSRGGIYPRGYELE